MMVGGKVIECRREGERTRLWCMDAGDELAIYVKTEPEMPAPGDIVWWQDRVALWTPADRRFTDRKLERIGYSFDPGV
jgi:hypothetical protein